MGGAFESSSRVGLDRCCISGRFYEGDESLVVLCHRKASEDEEKNRTKIKGIDAML
jgi:hypothetical protein